MSRQPVSLHDSLFTDTARLAQLKQVSDATGAPINHVRGCWAHWLWWKRQHEFDAVTPENIQDQPESLQVEPSEVDVIVGLDKFAAAMVENGWLEMAGQFVVSSKWARDARAARDATERAKREKQVMVNPLQPAIPRVENTFQNCINESNQPVTLIVQTPVEAAFVESGKASKAAPPPPLSKSLRDIRREKSGNK